jgi:putative sterol carrier protein
MAQFLSPEWVDELAAAAAGADAPGDVRLVVQQVVLDGDHEAAYALRIADGRVAVAPGRADDADITFTQDRATASAIARGELSAQAAFLAGRIRVGGEPARAMAGGRELTALGDLFAAVRAGTTW